MTPAQKRTLFPLLAPRCQTFWWWPVHLFSVMVDGYHDAYFSVMDPRIRR